MSRIIKSANVSLGEQMGLDNQMIVRKVETIKKENIQSKEMSHNNLNNEIKEVEEVKEIKSQEEIEAMYIEEARKKSELFFDTEMQRAYSEGMERANIEAKALIDDARSEAEKILAESIEIKNNIGNDYKNTMESMEKDIIDLVLEVAQRVVAKEIEKPDYIAGIVSEAMEKIASKKDTILKVSEDDYDIVIKEKEKILLNVEGFGEVEIVKEASLENGSCVVETKFGIIDGGIKTRMKQIEKEVHKILNR